MHPRRLIAAALLVALVALVATACSGGTSPGPSLTKAPTPSVSAAACPSAADPGTPPGWEPPTKAPTVLPVLINIGGELTCGVNRLLFTFVDGTGRPLPTPANVTKIAVYDLARDPSKATAIADATFIWAIEGSRGIYVATATFAEAGVWGAEFTTDVGGASQTIRMTFTVNASTPVVRVGQSAPATKTLVGADVGGNLAKISTDTKPDPAFYTTSIDTAVTSHKPFVAIFATPKFCVSAQCGPTLDRIKPFAAKYPTVTFIHVEPYKLTFDGNQLQPVVDGQGYPVTTDASNAWGLLSEPWVFVADRQGVVRGSFGLIFSDAELTAALDGVK